MNNTDDKSKNKNRKPSTRKIIIIAALTAAVAVGAIFLSGTKSNDQVGAILLSGSKSNDQVDNNTAQEENTESDKFKVEDITYGGDDYDLVVNDDVNEILLEAKGNFELLYSHGKKPGEIMRDHHNFIEFQHVDYIDRSMVYNYEMICNYTDAYKKGEYDTAYKNGKKLCEDYMTHMSPGYLFSLLVIEPCLSDDFVDDYTEIKDNIMYLENGKKIHLMGGNNRIFNPEESIISRFEYYRELPVLLLDKYEVIKDDSDDKDTCHVINISHVNRLCKAEMEEVEKRSGSDSLDYDKYADRLSKEDKERYEACWTVFGAIGHKSGDTDQISKIIDDLEKRHDDVK